MTTTRHQKIVEWWGEREREKRCIVTFWKSSRERREKAVAKQESSESEEILLTGKKVLPTSWLTQTASVQNNSLKLKKFENKKAWTLYLKRFKNI